MASPSAVMHHRGMSFKDHFSRQACGYARYRPSYPQALFEYLAEQTPSRGIAWDCGTGNGQAARALAGFFDRVRATDASAEQISQASGPANVVFQVAPAEQSGLACGAVDLVVVAQAFHWFDQPAFFAEVQRVLRPAGILAIWTYALMYVEPAIDRVIERYYRDVVGPYWPPERRQVEVGYRDVTLPFPELDPPTFDMTVDWDLAETLGYLGTWSASQRYREANGADPLEVVAADLRAVWGPAERQRTVRWPLNLRVGRKPA